MKLDETTQIALVVGATLFVFLGLPALVQKAAARGRRRIPARPPTPRAPTDPLPRPSGAHNTPIPWGNGTTREFHVLDDGTFVDADLGEPISTPHTMDVCPGDTIVIRTKPLSYDSSTTSNQPTMVETKVVAPEAGDFAWVIKDPPGLVSAGHMDKSFNASHWAILVVGVTVDEVFYRIDARLRSHLDC